MALSDDSIDIEFTFDFFKSETIFVMPKNRLQEGRRQGQGPGAYDEQIIDRRVEILEELKAAPSCNWRRLTVRDVPGLQAVGSGRQRRNRRLDALRYMQMVANGEFESMAYENGFFKGPVFFQVLIPHIIFAVTRVRPMLGMRIAWTMPFFNPRIAGVG